MMMMMMMMMINKKNKKTKNKTKQCNQFENNIFYDISRIIQLSARLKNSQKQNSV